MTRRDPARKRTTLALLIIVPLFLSAFAGNCRKKPDDNGAANSSGSASAQDIADADRALALSIREQFTKSPKVSGANITILPKNLVVFLSGEAASQAEFDEAIRIARETQVDVRGAKFKTKDVDASKLIIKPASP
jgi:BON domain